MTEPRDERRPSRVVGGWLVDGLSAALIACMAWSLAWRTTLGTPLDLAISAVTFVAVLLLLRAIRT